MKISLKAAISVLVSVSFCANADPRIKADVDYIEYENWTAEYQKRHDFTPQPPLNRSIPFRKSQYQEQGKIYHISLHHVGANTDGIPAEKLPGNPTLVDREKYTLGAKVWAAHVQKGWKSAAYHYLIGQSGTIYKGRPDNIAPASGTFYFPKGFYIREGGNYFIFKEKSKEWKENRGRAIDLRHLAKNEVEYSEIRNDAKREWKDEISFVPAEGDAVAPGETRGHITVSFIVNQESPSAAAQKAASILCAHLLKLHKLKPRDVRVHREVSTETTCPGRGVYSWLRGNEEDVMNPNHTSEGDGMRMIKEKFIKIGGSLEE